MRPVCIASEVSYTLSGFAFRPRFRPAIGTTGGSGSRTMSGAYLTGVAV
jgi:hypothetical protein